MVMGIWVHGYIGLWISGYVDMRVCGYMGVVTWVWLHRCGQLAQSATKSSIKKQKKGKQGNQCTAKGPEDEQNQLYIT